MLNIKSTYKSLDIEEWFDIYFTRPVGYVMALFFNKFNVHPNIVTILSMLFGIMAGIMFYHSDLQHNVWGVVFLMFANFCDSCDGQLARMAHKSSQWGRILDGFAGDVWFFCIYFAISCRLFHRDIPLTHMEWQWLAFIMCTISGVFFHARQCQLSDYYRNIHLYFLPNIKSELNFSSVEQQHLEKTPKKGNFWWRLFLKSYVSYTRSQERMTPHFQQMIQYIREQRNDNISDDFRTDFRVQSLPLMKYANIVTINCRIFTLFFACLIDQPWLYPIVEMTVFAGIAGYMRHRHENMCADFYEKLKQGKY